MTSKTMRVEPTDIGDLITALCQTFGYPKDHVAKIVLLPDTATFGVYKRNAKGKYITGEDEAAMGTYTYPILS